MRGRIVEWRHERGFGFIEPDSGGQRVFFHISDLTRGMPRPAIGTAVRFDVGSSADGKARALQIRPDGFAAALRVLVSRRLILAAASLSVFPILWVLGLAGRLPLAVFWIYVGMSFLSIVLYGLDKSAARRGGRRTPELTLQTCALLGGWPGALIAQQWFRHKSRKRAFQIEFWLMVVLNISAIFLGFTPIGRQLLAQMFR